MRLTQAIQLMPAVALAAALAGCTREQSAATGPPPAPVVVAQATQETVPVEVSAIANVEAYSTVSVKAQVDGQLLQVHFREGDDVRQGQLLFSLDPRPFEAALNQAEANLARDQAQLENARAQYRRYEKLLQEGVTSQEQYDQVRTAAEALEAVVRADKAAVETARLRLSYCAISSPLDGRTGSLIVHAGNLVKANDDPPLVVINQINPIFVSFTLPEQHLAEVKKYMARGKLAVEATVPDAPGAPERGTVSFVDNTVDTATGTIRLKAVFPNTARRLWPGQFVNVSVRFTERPNSIVVPSSAIQTGQSGSYVFVVKSDQTVDLRPVTTGISANGKTVIESGVNAGETVVTDGQLRLIPGAKVTIKSSLAGS
ncbi:MAG TPA: efflux RND transporter periplasmic adaptor subunit [Candidatus Xenobia bacterium]|nr:efflux RND transporter periplasmic adaptor subunit [Candidatus Xenobia bacterium]